MKVGSEFHGLIKTQFDFYLVYGFEKLIKVYENNPTPDVIDFNKSLFNDYILLGEKLFVFGSLNCVLIVTCINITNMNIIFQQSIYDIRQSLFEIGINFEERTIMEIDLFPQGRANS